MKQQNNTPGIITLPQPKSSEPASPSASPNRSRSQRPGPSASSTDKPLASHDDGHTKDNEHRRRRRTKHNNADSPLKQSQLASESDSLPSLALNLPTEGTTTDTPTKSRRRRGGRANRQPSPPLPDSAASPFPSTSPPQSDYDAHSTMHSRSVPPDPVLNHHLHPRACMHDAQSSGDEWEMPAAKPSEAAKPKENLSWQQELLRSGAGSALNSKSKGNDTNGARPRSRLNGGGGNGKDSLSRNGSLGSSASHGKPRPPLPTSVSENGTASGASLNWQQELLLHTTDLSTLHQPSPSKPVPVTTLTPARQRRNQIKDSITFGLANIDLDELDDELDDVFASPGRRQASHGHSHSSSRQTSAAQTGFSTPTKAPLEPRYAGPTFHNSPAPSSLPVPSFLLRKQAGVVA
ncbi:hypothetical protein JCM10207_001136 [Rhodosporidiobolus poonsookiae]